MQNANEIFKPPPPQPIKLFDWRILVNIIQHLENIYKDQIFAIMLVL